MSLIGLITLLTLVSCGGGGEDDLSAPETTTAAYKEDMVPITFSGSEGNEATVTRASGTPLYVSAQQFQVWGHKNMTCNDQGDADPSNDVYGGTQTVFPCYTVKYQANTAATTSTNTNNWEYILPSPYEQTIKFWDWSAKAYRFFAVTKWEGPTPANPEDYEPYKAYGANGVGDTYEVTMLTDATSTTEIDKLPYFSHLWFSTGDMVAYPDKQFGKPVTLEFLKPLTRVRYIYKYAFPRDGYFLENQSLKPSDGTTKIARKGTVTISYPLEGTETQESFSTDVNTSDGTLTDFTVDCDPDDDTKDYVTLSLGQMTADGWYIVAPNMSQGSYKLTVDINGVEKTAVVPANYMSWLPGYSYTYVFKITEEGGVEIGWVEAAVTPWNNQPADHTVYNW